MFTNPPKKRERGRGKHPPGTNPTPTQRKTVAATYSPTPPQGSTISVRRLHDRVRKETGYNPSTKTTTEKHREQCARTPSYLQRTSPRPISTGQLHVLPRFHLRPIYHVVYMGPYPCGGRSYLEVGFTLRCLQRLSRPHLATQLCTWQYN